MSRRCVGGQIPLPVIIFGRQSCNRRLTLLLDFYCHNRKIASSKQHIRFKMDRVDLICRRSRIIVRRGVGALEDIWGRDSGWKAASATGEENSLHSVMITGSGIVGRTGRSGAKHARKIATRSAGRWPAPPGRPLPTYRRLPGRGHH